MSVLFEFSCVLFAVCSFNWKKAKSSSSEEWKKTGEKRNKNECQKQPDVRQVKTTKKAAANDKKFFLVKKNVYNFNFLKVLWGASSELMFFESSGWYENDTRDDSIVAEFLMQN